MKSVITILAFLVFVNISFAQPHIEQGGTNPPLLPQVDDEGWYKQYQGTGTAIPHIFMMNRDTGWFGSLYTSNGGNSWEEYDNGRLVLQFVDNLHGWAGSHKGTGWLSSTSDGGKTWVDFVFPFDGARNLYFSSPMRGFCAAGGFIGWTSDGGKTWTLDTTKVGTISRFVSYDSLRVIASGCCYYKPGVSDAASVFLSTNGGETWRFTMKNPREGVLLEAVGAYDPSTIYFIGGTSPRISKSLDGGYLIPPCTVEDGGFIDGAVPSDGSATDINNVTVVGSSGVIYRTTDGKTWKRQNSGTTLDLDHVCFVDSTHGWASGSGYFLLHTSDAGKTWIRQTITIDSLNLQLHPNPTISILTAGFTLPATEHVTIEILDLTGRMIINPMVDVIQPAGIHFLPITVSELPPGVYILRLRTQGYQSTSKFSVIR